MSSFLIRTISNSKLLDRRKPKVVISHDHISFLDYNFELTSKRVITLRNQSETILKVTVIPPKKPYF